MVKKNSEVIKKYVAKVLKIFEPQISSYKRAYLCKNPINGIKKIALSG